MQSETIEYSFDDDPSVDLVADKANAFGHESLFRRCVLGCLAVVLIHLLCVVVAIQPVFQWSLKRTFCTASARMSSGTTVSQLRVLKACIVPTSSFGPLVPFLKWIKPHH